MPRVVVAVCLSMLIVGIVDATPPDESVGRLTIEKKTDKGKVAKEEVIDYTPREGDLVFYDDRNIAWMMLFAYAGSGPPLHLGIVVKNKEGGLSILEAGPDDTIRVELLDLKTRLPKFHADYPDGITIRRCKKELGKTDSEALTKFAHAQEGKRYAIGRLLLQGTSFRSRGPIRELFLGGTVLDRDSWICSELAVAAGTVAKLFDPKVVYANVAYPLDLVNNERYDLRATWHDAATWTPNK